LTPLANYTLLRARTILSLGARASCGLKDVLEECQSVTKRALIHCNADRANGMGHLVRSLSLAEEARSRGWEVTIAGKFGGRAIEHATTLAPTQELIVLGAKSLLEEIGELIRDRSAQLLHLDSYDSALDSFAPGS